MSHAGERSDRQTDVRPASPDQILDALNKFVVAFDIYADPDLKAKLALLAQSVENEPIWAIRQGVDDFTFGKVKRKRHGLPLASELGPHVADVSAWARDVKRAERLLDNRNVQFPPAVGDGIKFNMSPEERKACAKHFAAEYLATGSKSRPRFFAAMTPADIRQWLDGRRQQAMAA